MNQDVSHLAKPNVRRQVSTAHSSEPPETAYMGILDIVASGEELHRQFLCLIQTELEALNYHDINKIRALILLNIGESEMTVSDLFLRGCYLGTNVSYNLKKLTESDYVVQTRSESDRRVIRVRSSKKGLALCISLQDMNNRHIAALMADGLTPADADGCRKTLQMLQRFCSRATDEEAAIRTRPKLVYDRAV